MPEPESNPINFSDGVAMMIRNEVDEAYEKITAALVNLNFIQRAQNNPRFFYSNPSMDPNLTKNLPFPPFISTSKELAISFDSNTNGYQSLVIKWSLQSNNAAQDSNAQQSSDTPQNVAALQIIDKEVHQVCLTPSYAREDSWSAYDWVCLSLDKNGNVVSIVNEKFDHSLSADPGAANIMMTVDSWFKKHEPLLKDIIARCSRVKAITPPAVKKPGFFQRLFS